MIFYLACYKTGSITDIHYLSLYIISVCYLGVFNLSLNPILAQIQPWSSTNCQDSDVPLIDGIYLYLMSYLTSLTKQLHQLLLFIQNHGLLFSSKWLHSEERRQRFGQFGALIFFIFLSFFYVPPLCMHTINCTWRRIKWLNTVLLLETEPGANQIFLHAICKLSS